MKNPQFALLFMLLCWSGMVFITVVKANPVNEPHAVVAAVASTAENIPTTTPSASSYSYLKTDAVNIVIAVSVIVIFMTIIVLSRTVFILSKILR